MRVLLFFLLFTLRFAFAVLQGEVDYFNINSNEKKAQETQKAQDKTEYYKKLYEEADSWFPETTNPLERAFYKNPSDPMIVKLLEQFYEKRQERANLLAATLIALQTQKEEALRKKLSDYTVIYFYSPTCPYCRASETGLNALSSLVNQVLRVDVTAFQNQSYVRDFGIRVTPTLVFVKKGKEVSRWEGLWIYPSQKAENFLRELP